MLSIDVEATFFVLGNIDYTNSFDKGYQISVRVQFLCERKKFD